MTARTKVARSKKAARSTSRGGTPAVTAARRPKPTGRDATIDEYLARVSPSSRAVLLKLRKTIRSLVPDAEECISYGLPAFRHQGRIVAGFSATLNGCSYYPFSGTTLRTLASEIGVYSHTKSALHFGPAKPLPAALVRKLIEARMAEGGRRPLATARA